MHIFVFTQLLSLFLFALFVDIRLLVIQFLIVCLYMAGNISFNRNKTTSRKKMSFSSWGSPKDPCCYSRIKLNCEIIDDFINKYNSQNPKERISYTHFFLKLIGKSFRKATDINGTLSFGQFVPFESVDIGTVVNVDNRNLGTTTIRNCDTKSLSEIRKFTNKNVKKIKIKKDKIFKNQMKMTSMLPTFLVSCLLKLSTFLSYHIGMSSKVIS